ncbi:BgTH12-06567 [Blumeria graminis f. sp. triticale]|uniref:BgTH12-06567 n=1 Tax=Blumeria graminis f. sp. triticale TaxID=1689686 RepID=A0A9W4CYU0_BLUGR|nr:BgTH12-06567 [Blumeria graminis f. sp. triticale]
MCTIEIMCGRYVLALKPPEIREVFRNNGMNIELAPEDTVGHTPEITYNLAPGNHGLVLVPWKHYSSKDDPSSKKNLFVQGDASMNKEVSESNKVNYHLQTMKWGIVPMWSSKNSVTGASPTLINCRDDSLAENKNIWASLKNRNRCVVIAQGFYEWLRKDKDKIPYHIMRRDQKLICMAGLFNNISVDGNDDNKKFCTYTIITTNANDQLKFLHNRMPVTFEIGSEELQTWLDPRQSKWSKNLQQLLKPYAGELQIYPVSRDVGNPKNNSPRLILPIKTNETKTNIKNYFTNYLTKTESPNIASKLSEEVERGISNSEDKEILSCQVSNEIFGLICKKRSQLITLKATEKYNLGSKRKSDLPDDAPRKKDRKINRCLSHEISTKTCPRPERISVRSYKSPKPKRFINKKTGCQEISKFFEK